MEKTEEQLWKRKEELNKEIEELNKLIFANDFNKKLSEKEIFIGKYYKRVKQTGDDDYHRVFYVHGVDTNPNRIDLKTLEVRYNDGKDSYFSLEDIQYFEPNAEDYEKYEETTKEEFMVHYNNVKEIIKKIAENA